MKKVIVTGANGHLGYTLTKLLLEKGYKVRATVRNTDPERIGHLLELDAEIVQADIMKPETLKQAMKGIDGVFQVAAVYKLWAKDPEKEIIDPCVKGGLNVLEAASHAKIKKIIFTSSTAAVGNHAPADRALNEEDWNTDARLAYVKAKTIAERKAWEFSKKNDLNMVAVNPGAIIGPGFFRHTPSTEVLELALRNKLPGIPPYSFTYVDVRDVARLHLAAYEAKNAEGRYIAADKYLTLSELLEEVKRIDDSIKIPKMKLSAPTLRFFSAFDWLGNKLFGNDRQMTLESVSEFANRRSYLTADKAKKELGWKPMDFTKSLRDTLDWIKKIFIDK
ncbi:NAD-dependent epimerase/dehydratase family protein [candidate division WOR-3 bacterium]|nr:NAD-dependent epimerase/dehydratase family protein [candidate division WOR-3 bacterium]